MTPLVKYPVKLPFSTSPFVQSAPSVNLAPSANPAPRICQKPLKANPFECYRDSQTGRWVTVVSLVEPAETVAQRQLDASGGSILGSANAQTGLQQLHSISQAFKLEQMIGRPSKSLTTAAATAVTAVMALWVIAH
jgi:hypothetical protein